MSVPARIVSIEGSMADVSCGGTIFKAGLQMIEDAKPGDYVLLHAGFAIQKLCEEEAVETLRLLKEMKDAMNQM